MLLSILKIILFLLKGFLFFAYPIQLLTDFIFIFYHYYFTSVCHEILKAQSTVLSVLVFIFYLGFLQYFSIFYTDDTQIFISCPTSSFDNTVSTFINACNIFTKWLYSSFLKINPNKTNVFLSSVVIQCKIYPLPLNLNRLCLCKGFKSYFL